VVWFNNQSLGYYLTKLDYQTNFSSKPKKKVWWWKKIWKVKFLKKEKISMMLVASLQGILQNSHYF